MNTRDCKAIIFDMDGVLIDSDIIYERHWKKWAEMREVEFTEILAIHHGRPAIETMKIVRPDLDAIVESEAFNKKLVSDTDMEGIRAFEGVIGLLASLPDDRWAIATSAPSKMAVPKLEYLGLTMPKVLVTVDDVENGKPAPDPYVQAAAGLGLESSSCVVVEDAPAGIVSANTAGAFTIAVASTNKEEALVEADAVIAKFSDLFVSVNGKRLTVHWP